MYTKKYNQKYFESFSSSLLPCLGESIEASAITMDTHLCAFSLHAIQQMFCSGSLLWLCLFLCCIFISFSSSKNWCSWTLPILLRGAIWALHFVKWNPSSQNGHSFWWSGKSYEHLTSRGLSSSMAQRTSSKATSPNRAPAVQRRPPMLSRWPLRPTCHAHLPSSVAKSLPWPAKKCLF